MISQSTLTVKTETRTSETTVIMGLLSFFFLSELTVVLVELAKQKHTFDLLTFLLLPVVKNASVFSVLSAKISGWGGAGSTFNPVSKLAEKDWLQTNKQLSVAVAAGTSGLPTTVTAAIYLRANKVKSP
jgi:hypothetical protein